VMARADAAMYARKDQRKAGREGDASTRHVRQ
jgi:hypothetical protein